MLLADLPGEDLRIGQLVLPHAVHDEQRCDFRFAAADLPGADCTRLAVPAPYTGLMYEYIHSGLVFTSTHVSVMLMHRSGKRRDLI